MQKSDVQKWLSCLHFVPICYKLYKLGEKNLVKQPSRRRAKITII